MGGDGKMYRWAPLALGRGSDCRRRAARSRWRAAGREGSRRGASQRAQPSRARRIAVSPRRSCARTPGRWPEFPLGGARTATGSASGSASTGRTPAGSARSWPSPSAGSSPRMVLGRTQRER